MSKKHKSITDKIKVDTKVESEIITYGVFFQSCLARKQVGQHQEKEIRAFFKDLGLSDKEPVDKYKDALAKF